MTSCIAACWTSLREAFVCYKQSYECSEVIEMMKSLYCIVDANKNTDKHYERTRERFVNKVDRNYTEIRWN